PEAQGAPQQDYSSYWASVKEVHSAGKYGSIGYRYPFRDTEALKLVLRTHTTAVSTYMLHKLAADPRPARYFSIDRVFRNETVDATHLAEFHQVEGVIADFGLTLGGLIGFMEVFFGKMGIRRLRFKPAYNPYTEPSMEIFGFHEGLDKWVEIGNSGMFRPEMLEPMGLPKDMRVYGWGLSLERPTMIKVRGGSSNGHSDGGGLDGGGDGGIRVLDGGGGGCAGGGGGGVSGEVLGKGDTVLGGAGAIAVDVAGAEGIGAGLTSAEAGVGGEGLVLLTDSQLTGHELVQIAGDGAGSEESGCGEIEGMHRGFLLLSENERV
ncbi:MAG: hypothetical protein Q9177_002635, partial [Variospora cf. flavescens]